MLDEAAALATPDATDQAGQTSRPPEFPLRLVSTPGQREPWLLAWMITFHDTPPIYYGGPPGPR